MLCWVAFARQVLGIKGPFFPPTLEGILAWSNTFRCCNTFSNYLSYVRTGCLLVGASTETTRGEAVKRAKVAIAKRRQFVPRERQFVQRGTLIKIMAKAKAMRDIGAAILFLAAYVFLLRVPSEGLPMVRGGAGLESASLQSVISLEGEEVRCLFCRRSLCLVLCIT